MSLFWEAFRPNSALYARFNGLEAVKSVQNRPVGRGVRAWGRKRGLEASLPCGLALGPAPPCGEGPFGPSGRFNGGLSPIYADLCPFRVYSVPKLAQPAPYELKSVMSALFRPETGRNRVTCMFLRCTGRNSAVSRANKVKRALFRVKSVSNVVLRPPVLRKRPQALMNQAWN